MKVTRRTSLITFVVLTSLAGCASPPDPRSEVQINQSPDSQPAAKSEKKPTTSSASSHVASTPAKQPKGPSLDELLLFFPAKYPDGNWKPEGLQSEDAWFTAEDGTKLHGWYCPCDGARVVMLHAHGNAGNITHRAGLMKYYQQKLHVTSLIFDYRGYGRSDGTPTAEGVLQDARAARKWLADRAGIQEDQIVLTGQSLGGAVAVQLAADGARGLVLESTFSSLRDVAEHHYSKLAWLVPAGKLDSVAAIAKYKGPLLQCHGDADRTIPFVLGKKLYDAANNPKQFVAIPGGDHNDPASAEYRRELERFFGELASR